MTEVVKLLQKLFYINIAIYYPILGFLTLTGATIGEVTAAEFTGDSKTDVLIPNYTRNEIIILEQDD